MQKITVDTLKDNLNAVINSILDDQEPVTIVSNEKGREVVMVDAQDYNSLMETIHLLSNPANAERLQKGIAQHRKGQRKTIDVKPYLD